MIPTLVASLLVQTQGGGTILPKSALVTVPREVRDWSGFKFLPVVGRETPKAFSGGGDWSGVNGAVAANAVIWRTKVVILDRVDRFHERGPDIVWPGHHGLPPYVVERIKRALPQMHARVADLTGGAVNVTFDVVEEPEALITDGDLPDVVSRYLAPRINAGHFEAEDGVFRGPYQSVLVIHPMGGAVSPTFEVQGTPVTLVGLPDLQGEESDGELANDLAVDWQAQAARRAADAGATVENVALENDHPGPSPEFWPIVTKGRDASTEERHRMQARRFPALNGFAVGGNWNERGPETTVRLTKDPERGGVLTVEESGAFRQGGVALPEVKGLAIDATGARTLAFWVKSESKDPIVLQFNGGDRTQVLEKSVWLGRDVPFAYDNTWHRVKLDLRPLTRIDRILIAPDRNARTRVRLSLGPITASFSDFEATTETPDPKPVPESPSPTAKDPEARARWAADTGPGDERRALMKDPVEAVRANATAAALARPDPADERVLIENALYTFEPTIYTPALRALGNAGTPTAREAVKEALRIAAADRARGLAAEILAQPGDPKVVPLMIGLNQARTRAARVEAIGALGRIPGSEAALMRMAYLAQTDPEVKLAATLTADPNDDYQARKLLWSAVNEPSDAVRLESLRRLSSSTVAEFREEGLKGVRDDSSGVRIGLLETWTLKPTEATVPAIRIALGDKEPRVRAVALAAFAASAATVKPEEVPFGDADPRVQLAALRLAAAKGIAIPADVRDRLRKSPDAAVRAAVG